MLGLVLLALSVACVMMVPDLLAGAAYAATLGAGLGVLHVVQGAGMAEHFGTRHLGNLKGVSSMVGIFGAAAGPLPFAAWPHVGYLIFLASIAASLALGARCDSTPAPAGRDGEAVTPDDMTVVAGIPVPSTSPVFLAVVGCMFWWDCSAWSRAHRDVEPGRSGRHPTFGTIYYWGLVAVFVSATGLSVVRWARSITCSFSGLLALVATTLGAPPGAGDGSDGSGSTSPAWASPTSCC